jgi:dTDP-4-dehydrorhamnose 3,5-epimerase
MKFRSLDIPDVVLIQPDVFGDSRGYFFESWERRKFAAEGITVDFVQDNQSRSARHILRGLHYQIRQPQGKLVRVVTGAVFDVAVDLRQSSRTFGRWVGAILSEENHHILWVPPGFAHGFVVLSDCAHFLYRCTDFWAPEYERSILWNDADLEVKWPIPAGVEPLVSPKDACARRFRDAQYFP